MMNMMGTGAGSTLIGGIRVADWALGLTYGVMLLTGVLLIAYSIRALFQTLRGARHRGRENEPSVATSRRTDAETATYLASSQASGWTKPPHQAQAASWTESPQQLLITVSREASAARQYGEVIQGVSDNGNELRAAVFNENEVRAAAGLTLALGTIAFVYAYFAKIYLPIQVVTTLFFVEFLIRVTVGLKYSPMGLLGRWMTQRQPPHWVSAKPKRFAWTLGLAMSLAMMIITNIGIRGALPLTICLICLTLMWLEAVLGLCLGCEIHRLMVRRGWATKDKAFEVCTHGACTTEAQRFIGNRPEPQPQPAFHHA